MSKIIDLINDQPSSPLPLPIPTPTQNQNQNQPQPTPLSPALQTAIKTIDPIHLRSLILHYSTLIPALKSSLEAECLVQGKNVVRYESADENSEDDEEEEDEDDDESITEIKFQTSKRIAIGDEEFTARYAKCLNCSSEFDVSVNKKRDCVWHSGTKDVNYDSPFWDDHDEDCHGRCELFSDDPDYDEGFTWSCCEGSGEVAGCLITKHKTAINQVDHDVPPMPVPSAIGGKRKAEEELSSNTQHLRRL